jgi:hypothetical protein
MHVTATTVQHRYSYDAFGGMSILSPSFGSISASGYDWDFQFDGKFLEL